ncbi:TetR/AcrR family transcriptional regulator [Peribacillus sp. SCS-155]|uniref:TetR/AcrR family transcriptional regulator n=1 Tax=Peribacillus sedimenti TaxID=3115297 RepID=UPI003905B3B8
MKEKIHDQMVAGTRKLLKETIINLMEQKGFESMTVRDIASNAHLNRGTFYLHYRDKYELMERVQEELLDGLQAVLKEINIVKGMKYVSAEVAYPPLVDVFRYLKENGRSFTVLLGVKGDPAFQKKMKRIVRHTFHSVFVQYSSLKDTNVPMFHEYMPAFATSALFGLIEEWLERGMPNTPEEMAVMHFKILNFIRIQASRL